MLKAGQKLTGHRNMDTCQGCGRKVLGNGKHDCKQPKDTQQ